MKGYTVITYPEFDWTAREIAYNVLSSSISDKPRIYIPSKNYPRPIPGWRRKVEPKLKKASSFIFFAHDTEIIDPNTLWELEILRDKKGYFIVPHNMKIPYKLSTSKHTIITYRDLGDLISQFKKIFPELIEEAVQKEKKEQAICAIALIGVLALLMMALSDEKCEYI